MYNKDFLWRNNTRFLVAWVDSVFRLKKFLKVKILLPILILFIESLRNNQPVWSNTSKYRDYPTENDVKRKTKKENFQVEIFKEIWYVNVFNMERSRTFLTSWGVTSIGICWKALGSCDWSRDLCSSGTQIAKHFCYWDLAFLELAWSWEGKLPGLWQTRWLFMRDLPSHWCLCLILRTALWLEVFFSFTGSSFKPCKVFWRRESINLESESPLTCTLWCTCTLYSLNSNKIRVFIIILLWLNPIPLLQLYFYTISGFCYVTMKWSSFYLLC